MMKIEQRMVSSNHTEEYGSFRVELVHVVYTCPKFKLRHQIAQARVPALEYYAYRFCLIMSIVGIN